MKIRAFALVAAFCLLSVAGANAAASTKTEALSAYNIWFGGWVDYLESVDATWDFDSFMSIKSGVSSILAAFTIYDFPSAGENAIEAFSWKSTTGIIVSNAAPTPVPGPEAGAGLGALALGGIGYMVLRRRRLAVAA